MTRGIWINCKWDRESAKSEDLRTLSWTGERLGSAIWSRVCKSADLCVCLCMSESRWRRRSGGSGSGALTEWGRPLQNDMLITSTPPQRVPKKVGSDNSDAFGCETLPHSQTHRSWGAHVCVCVVKGEEKSLIQNVPHYPGRSHFWHSAWVDCGCCVI